MGVIVMLVLVVVGLGGLWVFKDLCDTLSRKDDRTKAKADERTKAWEW